MPTQGPELIERICAGEQVAAVDLVDLYYEKIYAFLRRLSTNEADAADLTQRTFGKVWESLAAFSGRSTVSSWIHSIAYHTYVDWLRGNHRMEPRPSEWWAERISAEAGPDEVASRNDLAASVYAAVDRLAPDLRDTVHLHYYQELTLQETADAMGIATSTVKYRLRQALVELEARVGTDSPGVHLPAASKRI
ncbi:MAG TPA: RNA polymerase sigma factor [Verrucomicrobiae bacterium]|nr:RNA polymerase sigma factor [Verrucomicrobiae bacterium]